MSGWEIVIIFAIVRLISILGDFVSRIDNIQINSRNKKREMDNAEKRNRRRIRKQIKKELNSLDKLKLESKNDRKPLNK